MYSFVIPTMRPRRALLERCLRSLGVQAAALGAPAEAFVIVEGPGDVDGLAAFGTDVLRIEPLPLPGGAALRRNAAFARVGGQVVALLDDDAEPLEGYGDALRSLFADPATQIVQGAIWPDFEVEPDHALEPVAFSLGGFNCHGERRREGVFISANCAFTRGVLERVGPMREDLGPGSGAVPWGDDTEWHRRATAMGVATRYAQELAVRHRVQADRVTEDALLRRAGRVGRTRARLEWDASRPGPGTVWHQRALAAWARLRHARRGIEGRLLTRRLAGYADEVARIRAGDPPGTD